MNFNITFPSRRSNIIAQHGLVATSQPLAAQAGLDVLKRGGNAIDAAIATVATLCVVEPCSTGIGGDAFALIWSAEDKKLYGLNASGPSPAALTAEAVRQQGHQTFPTLGALPITVPGSLRGWQMALERFGTQGLNTLLAQAISYARDGFPVSERIAHAWARSEEKMNQHPDSARVWLPNNGRAPRIGQLFRNPEFAHTLQAIAHDGVELFYNGDIAAQMAHCVQEAGGFLTKKDLRDYRAEWVAPLRLDYRDGYSFYEIPPNGQGLTALLALNLVKGSDVRELGHGSLAYNHLLMEAIKLAFADAHTYIADPRKAAVPLAGLLSESYTAERRALIQPHKAINPFPGQPHKHGDTVYLTVADEAGNMVSWIQSLYMGFGSGLTAGTTGVQLQNRGANFSLEAGHPNEADGGKRPYHTIIPGFITKDERPWSSFGVMGGFMQPQGHLQVGLNLVDFGLSPQAALDAPRFNWQKGKQFALEAGFGAEMAAQLAQLGHELMSPQKAAQQLYGGGQVIVRDPETGIYIGGSEPRNDGTAVGF